MNKQLFRKVMCSDRFPEKEGDYIVNSQHEHGKSMMFLLWSGKRTHSWGFVNWWLEPIEIPTYEKKNKICKNIINVISKYIKGEWLIAEIETDLVFLTEFESIMAEKLTDKMSAEEFVKSDVFHSAIDNHIESCKYGSTSNGASFKDGVIFVLKYLNQQP